MNLLVCQTDAKAKEARDLFGLGREWKALGLETATYGSRYEKILVVLPSGPVHSQLDDILRMLQTRVVPGGVLKVLNYGLPEDHH